MKRILFVDDALQRMLRPMRSEWEMSFALGGEAALSMLEVAPFDVIVTDMRMPGIDGAALLEIVREKYPSMLRIILSGYTEMQASLRAVPVAHQFLAKPCEPEMLRDGIARATSLGEVLNSKMFTSLVGSLRELPSLPRVLTQLKAALARPTTTIEQITEIVEQDVAVSAKILQLVNSAFFGLVRDVGDMKTAVSCLGMSLLHNLVVTVEIFRLLTPNEYVSQQFLEDFQEHAKATARIAAGIAKDGNLPHAVVLAALMHDVGKLVIAERTPGHFMRASAQVRDEHVPLYQVEEKLTHFSHAEVGRISLACGASRIPSWRLSPIITTRAACLRMVWT
ncbi:MAG: HDOD domain-containing protein [Candidatus Acidiferrum sp.]